MLWHGRNRKPRAYLLEPRGWLLEEGKELDWGRQTLGFWFTSSLRTCLNRKRGALETPRSLKKAWNPGIGSPLLWAENRSFRSSENTGLQLHTTSKMHRVMASGWQINLRRGSGCPGPECGVLESQGSQALGTQPCWDCHQPPGSLDYFSKALVTADIKIRKHGQIPDACGGWSTLSQQARWDWQPLRGTSAESNPTQSQVATD